MNKNQKGFANIVLVVVIVILVGAVGYFGLRKNGLIGYQTPTPTQTTKSPMPTPDKTANWKTYVNNTIDLIFKYPQDWYVNTEGSGPIDITNYKFPSPNDSILPNQFKIQVQTYTKSATQSLVVLLLVRMS